MIWIIPIVAGLFAAGCKGCPKEPSQPRRDREYYGPRMDTPSSFNPRPSGPPMVVDEYIPPPQAQGSRTLREPMP